MLDVIFVLFLNAAFFLGIAASAAFLLLPFVKLFGRKLRREKMEYVEDCAGY